MIAFRSIEASLPSVARAAGARFRLHCRPRQWYAGISQALARTLARHDVDRDAEEQP